MIGRSSWTLRAYFEFPSPWDFPVVKVVRRGAFCGLVNAFTTHSVTNLDIHQVAGIYLCHLDSGTSSTVHVPKKQDLRCSTSSDVTADVEQ